MNNKGKIINDLQAEIERLRGGLEKAKEQGQNLENSRRAMLYMLEDLNKQTVDIRNAKKEWEETFDAISNPILVHDKEFKIIRANKAYQKAAGMPFKELIWKPYYEVFPKMEGPFKMWLNAKELQEVEEEKEEEFLCPVTNRIFKVRFYPLRGMDGSLIYLACIMEDITNVKRGEEKLKNEVVINTHLLMIAEAVADTTDIGKLIKQVVYCTSKIFRSDICLSYLYDEEDKVFKPNQSYNLSPDMVPIFMTEAIDEKVDFVRSVMEWKEVVVLLNKGGEGVVKPAAAKLFEWIEDIYTIFAIPLIGREGYLGLLINIYRSQRDFDERDRKVMKGISQHVSVAIEQAHLYRDSIDRAMELSYKIETIQVMHEIDKNILSTLEPAGILEIAVRMITKVIPCDRATIVLVDKERGGFTYTAGFGVSFIQKGALLPFGDTNATEIIKTGRSQYVANLTVIKKPLSIEKNLIEEGFLSHIRVPLLVKNEIVGILTVGAKRHSAFTPENLSTLEKLVAQIGVALSNARLVTELEELFLGTVKSLSSAIDAKSPWTAGHSERVTKYAVDIGKGMKFSEKELRDIELGGLLHDIGKLGTYETILDKPGKLTDEEFKLIKQHPIKGAEILSSIKQIRHVIPIVKHHHEFYNGKGYPDGLKGEEIHLMARIMCVADSVDAMGADRPYRKGRPMDEIIVEVKRCSGMQFDPAVVEIFLKVV